MMRRPGKDETMAREKSRFMIGLFVTIGVLIGAAAVVWLGASKYFEAGKFYITYFDESVQGLQVDSRVKYRGVDIGKVESIGVAPDHTLVEVVMKIDLEGEAERNLVAQLRAAGITGIVFIELDRRNPEDPVLLPPSGMKTNHPVIASQLSQAKQLLTSADKIMGRIEQVDFKGISDQIKQTSQAMEIFLTGRQMTAILKNLDSTTESLDHTLRRIDRIVAEGKVEGVLEEARLGLHEARKGLDETRQGLQETRKVIAEVRELVVVFKDEIKNLKAAEIAGKAGRLIDGLDRRTRGMKEDVERTADDIRQAVESLKLLLDRLHANPSDLLFSRPVGENGERGNVTR
jgi:phospholipid/cholesterol/gamma-HCH transport system substrate-binding protein